MGVTQILIKKDGQTTDCQKRKSTNTRNIGVSLISNKFFLLPTDLKSAKMTYSTLKSIFNVLLDRFHYAEIRINDLFSNASVGLDIKKRSFLDYESR